MHIGPQISGQARPNSRDPGVALDLPAGLADLALVDAKTAAAAASLSLSQWYELVASGQAPQPAFRRPRCTRWRLTDVRSWLREFAAQGGTAEGEEAERVLRATVAAATRAASAKRKASEPAR